MVRRPPGADPGRRHRRPGPDVLDIDSHGPAASGFPALERLCAAGLLGGLPLRSIKVVLSGPPESALTLN